MSFGATLPIPGLGVLDDPDGPATRSTGVLFWVRSHPVMRYVTMSEVWVNSPLRLTLPDPNGASSGAGLDVEALATGADGPLITLIEQGGVRRLVVGFDIGESNWIRDAGFHIFLKNAMDYLTLTGEDEAGRIVRTGETAAVRTRPGAKRLEAKGPAVYSREVEPGGGEWVPLGPFERVGVYALDGASEENRLLAVNLLEPLESALESRESVEVAGGSVTAARAGSIAPREVWPWFVLAAVVLLAVEWLVFALRMRV